MEKFSILYLAIYLAMLPVEAIENSGINPSRSFPQSAFDAAKNSLKEGNAISAFELRNNLGERKKITEFLKQGPVIISFYRGGWCSFCNEELKSLKRIHDSVRALGGQILAISPEASHKLRQTQERHNLPFELLSDEGNRVAQSFGIAFQLDSDTSKTYRENRIVNLKKWNANGDEVLPISATFLVESNLKITYSFVEPDYKKRVDKSVLLSQLKRIVKPLPKQSGNYLVKIKGMTCEGCAEGINRLLSKDKRIKASLITFAESGGLVETNHEEMDQKTLTELIENMEIGRAHV